MPLISRLAPTLFVLIWSTGFVVAKYSMFDAQPFTFLSLRMAASAMVLIPILYLYGQKIPTRWWSYRHDMVVGVLLQTGYLGAYFLAIRMGADAGTSAIIIGLQPIVTTGLAMAFLGEPLPARVGLGLLLGFVGVSIVVGVQTGFAANTLSDHARNVYLLPVVSLLSICAALIYQKKFCRSDQQLTRTWMQYVAAAITCPLAAILLGETWQVSWTPSFMLAFIWQVLALSVGAILLLMQMVNRGEASRVSSLFYLVPPLVVVEAYFMFDEQFNFWAILGMGLAISGVILVRQRCRKI